MTVFGVLDYINDGAYGALNCVMFNEVVFPVILTLDGKFCSSATMRHMNGSLDNSEQDSDSRQSFASEEFEECKIFGPSCDSGDLVCPRVHLPTKALKVGDWLKWTRMGAYSVSCASQFNGFKISQVRYTIDSKGDQALADHLRSILGCV